MIEYLFGKILKKSMPHIILDVGGVGYGVEWTLTAFAALPPEGSSFPVWVYTRVREDQLKLYGFPNLEDRKVFEILLEVNGIGPKVALAILSTLSVRQLKFAIEERDVALLEAVPGIGKRTAEKIVVELQSKVEKFPLIDVMQTDDLDQGQRGLNSSFESARSQTLKDLASALDNLGFKKKEYTPILDKFNLQGSEERFPELMRRALAQLKPLDKSRDLDQLF
jgi:Holliday junction DNA helicase RuvA